VNIKQPLDVVRERVLDVWPTSSQLGCLMYLTAESCPYTVLHSGFVRNSRASNSRAKNYIVPAPEMPITVAVGGGVHTILRRDRT